MNDTPQTETRDYIDVETDFYRAHDAALSIAKLMSGYGNDLSFEAVDVVRTGSALSIPIEEMNKLFNEMMDLRKSEAMALNELQAG